MHEARDKDMELKQKRTDYADTRRNARKSDFQPGDKVFLKQNGRKTSCVLNSRVYHIKLQVNAEMKLQSLDRKESAAGEKCY